VNIKESFLDSLVICAVCGYKRTLATFVTYFLTKFGLFLTDNIKSLAQIIIISLKTHGDILVRHFLDFGFLADHRGHQLFFNYDDVKLVEENQKTCSRDAYGNPGATQKETVAVR
jgi:hypothetical protein